MKKTFCFEAVSDKFEEIVDNIKDEYTKPHNYTWFIGFSGGKDSSLLLHLVLDVLHGLHKDRRKRAIWVVGNDTLVESPLVINHLKMLHINLIIELVVAFIMKIL